MTKTAPRFERLSDADETWLATEIHRLLPTLRSDERRYAWAYALVDDLLWFWTADAVHQGKVKRDAIKADRRYQHSTAAARSSLADREVRKEHPVQHDHAGEIARIIAVLEKHGHTVAAVLEILRHLNVAVLVTAEEHKLVRKRSWPDAWRARRWQKPYEDLEIGLQAPEIPRAMRGTKRKPS